MKPFVAFFVLAAFPGWAMAQTPPAPVPATPEGKSAPAPATASGMKTPAGAKIILGPTPPKTTTAAKAPAPPTKTPATKGATAKKDEPPPKIEGMEIARSAKGFLGLQVVGGSFVLSFYDAKKKPVTPDVVRAVLRWTPNNKKGAEIYVLGPGDGKSLTVAKTVRPPYNFKLFLSLFTEGVEEPAESFVVDFKQ